MSNLILQLHHTKILVHFHNLYAISKNRVMYFLQLLSQVFAYKYKTNSRYGNFLSAIKFSLPINNFYFTRISLL